jgi:hypothetical protein
VDIPGSDGILIDSRLAMGNVRLSVPPSNAVRPVPCLPLAPFRFSSSLASLSLLEYKRRLLSSRGGRNGKGQQHSQPA